MLSELRLTNIELVAAANIRAGFGNDTLEVAAEIRRLRDGIAELHANRGICYACGVAWPCPTAQLIEAK